LSDGRSQCGCAGVVGHYSSFGWTIVFKIADADVRFASNTLKRKNIALGTPLAGGRAASGVRGRVMSGMMDGMGGHGSGGMSGDMMLHFVTMDTTGGGGHDGHH